MRTVPASTGPGYLRAPAQSEKTEAEGDEKATDRVAKLGGSGVSPDGGPGFRALSRLVGWKQTKRIQAALHRAGWAAVAQHKNRRRVESLDAAE